MAERAESVIPAEADIGRTPGLLDGAMSLDLTPQTCNMDLRDSRPSAMGLH